MPISTSARIRHNGFTVIAVRPASVINPFPTLEEDEEYLLYGRVRVLPIAYMTQSSVVARTPSAHLCRRSAKYLSGSCANF